MTVPIISGREGVHPEWIQKLELLVKDLICLDVPPRSIGLYPCDDIIHFRELMGLIKAFAQAVRVQGRSGYLLLDEIPSA